MKKHLLALAALATVSGAAVAQSVTVYGAVDGGITSYNHQGSAKNQNVTAFQNGGLSPSIIGFKGSEDLGGGLKAVFNLEGHLSTGDGSQKDATGAAPIWGGLFGRQANVGLSTTSGTVLLGRQFSPAVLAFAATDPRGLKETNSGLITWLYSGNVVTSAATLAVNSKTHSDIFMSDAISFSTNVAGVNLAGAYSIGGAAGQASKNEVKALGASTAVNGVTLSTGYQVDNGNDANTNKSRSERYSVGAGFAVGSVGFKANYLSSKVNNANGVGTEKEVKTYGLGVDYSWAPKNVATLAYYDSKNSKGTNDTSKTTILSNDYSLSKRTTLYALVANNKGGSGFASAAQMGLTALNTSVVQYQLGVNHKF